MKYFTKEELEDITNELLANPTRETLKSLNEKYNVAEEARDESASSIIPQVENMNIAEETKPALDNPFINQEIPNTENSENNSIPSTAEAQIPSLELPIMEPQANPSNSNPVPFSGNLWENQAPNLSMMETTDNFNGMQQVNSQPQVAPIPPMDFNASPTDPVAPAEVNPNPGPTMFAEAQQNYM